MNELQGYPVPVFWSEDGCNLVRPRTFSDMQAIYGPNMTPIMSGTIVYEWTQETNDYGIIQYPDTAIQDGVTVPVGVPVPLQPEFNNLKSAWANVSPTIVAEADYKPTMTVVACPAVTEGIWTIDGNAALPEKPGNLTPPKPTSYTFTGTLPSVTVNSLGSTIAIGTPSPTGGSGNGNGNGNGSGSASTASASTHSSSSGIPNTCLYADE